VIRGTRSGKTDDGSGYDDRGGKKGTCKQMHENRKGSIWDECITEEHCLTRRSWESPSWKRRSRSVASAWDVKGGRDHSSEPRGGMRGKRSMRLKNAMRFG
jgi:hypothetical protein